MNTLRRYPLPLIWSLACSAIVVALCINGIIAYRALNDLARNQQDVAETLAIMFRIQSAYTALLSADVGQRSHLLTGQEEYLRSFRADITEAQQHLSELRTATENEPGRQQVRELSEAIDHKISELRALDAQAETDRSAAVDTLLARGSSRTIRHRVAELQARQQNLLSQREAEARRSQRSAFWTLVIATGLSLLLVVLIYFVVKRGTQTRETLAHNLQKANDDLENKVNERTAALSHYADELQRSNRELQDFAFVASHDLQEPLRKIRAFGNRLQQKYAPQIEAQGADYVNRMQAAAERMSRLINDLLAFSRVATKGKPFQETSLDEVIVDVLEDLEVAIEDVGADVQVEKLPEIDADTTQMRQLFQNLLGNAIKFRRPQEQPRIQVTCRILDTTEINGNMVAGACEIAVRDNGIGFDEQFLDRIFTPFQRLHGRDEYDGTGIGLAVCRRIVERHGGKITASSRAGEGSTFVVTLPLRQSVKPLQEIYDNEP